MVSTPLFPSGPDIKCIILPDQIHTIDGLETRTKYSQYLTDVVTRVLQDQLDCFLIDICFSHSTCFKDDTTICRAMTYWKTTIL